MRDELPTVFVVHGAGEPRRREGEIYWKPLLESSLGQDCEIRAPRMPEPEDPHHAAWASCITQQISGLDRPLLVGHSFGASTLLKFLAQADPLPEFRGLFLVSTPFWGSDFPEYALTAEELRQLQTVGPLFFYQSKDDPVVEVSHFEKFRKALPHATYRLLEKGGHEFDLESFPELADDIRSVVSPVDRA